MIFIYYIVVALVLLVVGPLLLISRPKTRAGLSDKLGLIPDNFKKFANKKEGECRIWFHSVSVGEFNAAYPLIKALKEKYPKLSIFVSTTTQTGQRLAKERTQDGTQDSKKNWANVFYFPFDLPFATNAWLNCLKPDLIAIVETEIWPGLINQCRERQIPTIMVNGRISPRSYKRYCQLKWFFGKTIRSFAAIGAQTEQEADRFRDLCDKTVSIKVMGNLKYDFKESLSPSAVEGLRTKTGLSSSDTVVIAGSTHEGEEKAVLDYYSQKKSKIQSLRLVIAPRHPERFDRVQQLIESQGLRVRRHSKEEKIEHQSDVYLLDTIGLLADIYSLAAVAFVGGTLDQTGGHNLLEPYMYGAPVVCGPNVQKTKAVADALSGAKALSIGSNQDEVQERLSQLIENEQLRHEMGRRGQEWLAANHGAINRAIEIIEQVIPSQLPLLTTPIKETIA